MAKTLRDRLIEKQAGLKKGGSNGILFFPKEGTTRVRVLNVGSEEDFSMEVIHFYLGPKVRGVISPSTVGAKCRINEEYEKLKKSKDPGDADLAKEIAPKRKHLIPVLVYKDTAGKELDENNPRLMMVGNGLLSDMITLFTDDEEWGDFTDPKDGYDLKITRSGKGKTDTEYSVAPCQKTRIPKDYKDKVDLLEMVTSALPTYEETQAKLNEFINGGSASEEDEDTTPAPKKSGKKLLRRKSDI